MTESDDDPRSGEQPQSGDRPQFHEQPQFGVEPRLWSAEGPASEAAAGDDPLPGSDPLSDDDAVPGTDTVPATTNGGGQHGPGRGRWRWIALTTVIAAVIAAFVTQHYVRGDTDESAVGSPPGSASTDSTDSTESTPRSSPGESRDGHHTNTASPGWGATWVTDSDAASAPNSSAPGAPTSSTDSAAPSTTEGLASSLPADEDLTIVGYVPPDETGYGAAVVTYRSSTGRLVNTPIPTPASNGPISFVATVPGTIVRPLEGVTGYLVPSGDSGKRNSGSPAVALAGTLAQRAVVLPGTDGRHVWAATYDHTPAISLIEVDTAGQPTGATITIPGAVPENGSYNLLPDGSGYALARGVGGTYLLTPDGAELVTHGVVLAAGPAVFLVYECDQAALCQSLVVDRKTGEKHALTTFDGGPEYALQGVTSPDGRYAGLLRFDQKGPRYVLADLRSGVTHGFDLPLASQFFIGGASRSMIFTPDNRYLLLSTAQGVVPVDTSTATALDPLPLPPMGAIALRPAQ